MNLPHYEPISARATAAGALGLALAMLLAAAPTHAAGLKDSKAAQPRYTIASGHGWAVCEAYVKFLNGLPPGEEPPMCDLKLARVPGMKEPDWELLDIEQHLDLVHQIELILGKSEIEPEPAKDFAAWQAQRRERVASLRQQPRLRRARLAITQGGPVETVLAYDFDANRCAGELRKARQGILYDIGWPDLPHFFVLDRTGTKVLGRLRWQVDMRGTLWLYQGAPYYVSLAVKDVLNDTGISLYVKRLQPVPNSWLADEPLYARQELCRIRFDYPFPPLPNIN